MAMPSTAKAREVPTLRFNIQAPGLPGRTIEFKQDIIKIGKLSSSHIQIQDSAVSRVHAVIEITPQSEVFIIDLGSSNGTHVNGEKISSGQKQRLSTGDELRLGQTRLWVTIDSGDPSAVTDPVGRLQATDVRAAASVATPPVPEPAPVVAAEPGPAEPAPAPPPPVAPDLFSSARAAPGDAPAPVASVAPAPMPVRPEAAPRVEPAPVLVHTSTPAPAAPEPSAPLAVPPQVDDDSGRDRRFEAIHPAEPLSEYPASIIEARLAFGRDIIESRTYESARSRRSTGRKRGFGRTSAVTIGPTPTCDFIVEGFPAPFALLRAQEDGFLFRFRQSTLGRVRLGDKDISLADLTQLKDCRASDEAGTFEWPFRQGALISLKVGGTTLYLRSVPKAPPAPVTYFSSMDQRLILAFLGVTLFSGALVWRAVTWPETPAVLLEDKFKLDDRLVSFLTNPEERQRKAQIYGAKMKKDEKEEGGAVKGKEGQSGRKDAPREKRRLALAGKQKEYTPAEQRERDLRKVSKLGVLDALTKDATLKEIFTGGGGRGPSSPFGIGAGGGPDDTTAWGGLNDGPPGEGYGTEGWGLVPGGGTGGGGMGRYVGVGRLATRGVGGRGGKRWGAGVAKFGDHQVAKPKVIMEEPDVGGGLTREIIQRVIRSHLHEIRYCYERELAKDKTLGGKIVVKFTILPSGRVHEAGKKSSNMRNEDVVECILARVVRWQFPKPHKGVPVMVSYPFLFKRMGED